MASSPWKLRPVDEEAAGRLHRELGVSLLLARLLVQRGLSDPQAAHRFLNPSLSDLHDPFLLPDMETAARRIAQAIRQGESILVHGDYDVDGITSAALLTRALEALGAQPAAHVPHRTLEGYDLQVETVERAASDGVRLIITTDCGTSALEPARRARDLGVDLIVTDHHQPGPELPPALALVNPHLPGSRYPFPDLCAAAVALKLVCALCRELGHTPENALKAFLDLAALGTAADLMPLRDENRALVRFGLEALNQTRKLGLLALMQMAGCHGRAVTAWDLSFVLGPRLNAIGRVDDAKLGLELLVTRDERRALELARLLEEMNRKRKTEQARVLREATEQITRRNLQENPVLVLSGEGWHYGVLGLVASKLVETYGRPAVVIGAENGTGRASCRSLGAFHIMQALDSCRDLLIRCGGHQGAAGLDLEMANLEAFDRRINEIARQDPSLLEQDSCLPLDLVLAPEQISESLLRELGALGPFGVGNPEPVLASTLTLLARRRVGGTGSHLKMSFRGDGLAPIDAIAWRCGDWHDALRPGADLEICFRLRRNSYNGRDSLQLEVQDLRDPSGEPLLPVSLPPGAQADPFAPPAGAR